MPTLYVQGGHKILIENSWTFQGELLFFKNKYQPQKIQLQWKLYFVYFEKFCYLGDTIGARGGAEDSVTTRVRSGWNKFRELLPLLASRSLPLLTKGKVYQSCVHSVMLYGSETWPVKEDDVKRLERNENRMIRWICGVSLHHKVSSFDLRNILKLCSLRECIQCRRLQ